LYINKGGKRKLYSEHTYTTNQVCMSTERWYTKWTSLIIWFQC